MQGLALLDDNTFEVDYICELVGGDVGMEVTVGQWDAVDGTLVMTASAGTCPRPAGPLTTEAPYELIGDGDSLRIVTPTSIITYSRCPECGMGNTAEGGGRTVLGCWDSAGALEPRPFQDW